MEFRKETQGMYSYLVYELNKMDEIDELSLGMITNNNILGIMSVIFTQLDDKKYFKYNISKKIPVTQFFSGIVNKKRLLSVFESIADALISASEYMIEQKTLILDLDYIFVDVITSKAELISLPVIMGGDNTDILMFFKNIMFSTQFDQRENCDYVAGIINYLNSTSVFQPEEFKNVIKKLSIDTEKSSVNKINRGENVRDKDSEVTINNNLHMKSDNSVKVESVSSNVLNNNIQQNPNANLKLDTPVSNNNISIPDNIANHKEKTDEKKISMFGLLMHYSKENKELYKQQKKSKKHQSETVSREKNSEAKKASAMNHSQFAVPGIKNQSQMPAASMVNADKESVDVQENKILSANLDIGQNNSKEIGAILQPRTNYSQVSANFGETTVLGGGVPGETTVLTAAQTSAQQPAPYIIRQKNNEKIPINKPRFRIGKEKSYVDYFIGDNTAISRSHADIVTVDNTYFIIDMNSTNHTFINGNMIQSGDQVQMNHGDILKLANEEFEFRIY